MTTPNVVTVTDQDIQTVRILIGPSDLSDAQIAEILARTVDPDGTINYARAVAAILDESVDRPPNIITGADLSRAIGGSVRQAACDEAADIVSGLIEGWTRGRSRYPDAVPRDLAAVARAASLRLASNLSQTAVSVEGQSLGAGFRGFTLHEQVVLNRYRRRCA